MRAPDFQQHQRFQPDTLHAAPADPAAPVLPERGAAGEPCSRMLFGYAGQAEKLDVAIASLAAADQVT